MATHNLALAIIESQEHEQQLLEACQDLSVLDDQLYDLYSDIEQSWNKVISAIDSKEMDFEPIALTTSPLILGMLMSTHAYGRQWPVRHDVDYRSHDIKPYAQALQAVARRLRAGAPFDLTKVMQSLLLAASYNTTRFCISCMQDRPLGDFTSWPYSITVHRYCTMYRWANGQWIQYQLSGQPLVAGVTKVKHDMVTLDFEMLSSY